MCGGGHLQNKTAAPGEISWDGRASFQKTARVAAVPPKLPALGRPLERPITGAGRGRLPGAAHRSPALLGGDNRRRPLPGFHTTRLSGKGAVPAELPRTAFACLLV